MIYFDMICDKIMYREKDDLIYYTIKNKEKFGGDIDKIIISGDHEKNFITSLEKNDNIIYWNYKAIDIEYTSPTKEKCIYQPLYYVIVKEKNELGKIIIFDIQDTNTFVDMPMLTEEEIDGLSVEDFNYYKEYLDEMQIILDKYDTTKRYCKTFNIDFCIITNQGIQVVVVNDTLVFN